MMKTRIILVRKRKKPAIQEMLGLFQNYEKIFETLDDNIWDVKIGDELTFNPSCYLDGSPIIASYYYPSYDCEVMDLIIEKQYTIRKSYIEIVKGVILLTEDEKDFKPIINKIM